MTMMVPIPLWFLIFVCIYIAILSIFAIMQMNKVYELETNQNIILENKAVAAELRKKLENL